MVPSALPLNFSIVIPTYNGAQRLPGLFACLDRCWHWCQNQDPVMTWEVIVVDNGSQDETRQVVEQYQNQWADRGRDRTNPPQPWESGPSAPIHPGEPLPLVRYAFEPQPGAAHARQRGVTLAQAEWIGFLDDDNWPEPDWIGAALAFAQAHPRTGAIGSQIHGAFATPPPPELDPLLPYLAIVERGDRPLEYLPQKKLLPPSAGLVVRRSVWLTCLPHRLRLTGRTATSMLTAEDLEALAHILRHGWQVWYNPAMVIHHQIPPWRLQASYLLPFFQGIGLSRHVTRILSVPPWQRPLWFGLYIANDLRRILRLLLSHGLPRRSNLVARCYLTLYGYSLLSPFYLGWQGIRSGGRRRSSP
ncbi:hormogonium polysaccharide biosynthesis glycosyltransferase HpsE [Prochlorothrix hollandica]|uniref:Glycosyltransferase 2-like domain-containing protein n=1 Tax=Prochlorothrix hollandica PCC 9006 = CALU 1027 TaxID=317619 RepID=A0A0M2PW25_PROHO|nr:hormogonium polysaccharide biosynthesis glycosyltransferase HpsE [Prochlorothrix hollandica]KKI98576.1 hypothetical protein PROH_16920 [Prochlorothrix hollandica PCC 9006 = CALU 1027]